LGSFWGLEKVKKPNRTKGNQNLYRSSPNRKASTHCRSRMQEQPGHVGLGEKNPAKKQKLSCAGQREVKRRLEPGRLCLEDRDQSSEIPWKGKVIKDAS